MHICGLADNQGYKNVVYYNSVTCLKVFSVFVFFSFSTVMVEGSQWHNQDIHMFWGLTGVIVNVLVIAGNGGRATVA